MTDKPHTRKIEFHNNREYCLVDEKGVDYSLGTTYPSLESAQYDAAYIREKNPSATVTILMRPVPKEWVQVG